MNPKFPRGQEESNVRKKKYNKVKRKTKKQNKNKEKKMKNKREHLLEGKMKQRWTIGLWTNNPHPLSWCRNKVNSQETPSSLLHPFWFSKDSLLACRDASGRRRRRLPRCYRSKWWKQRLRGMRRRRRRKTHTLQVVRMFKKVYFLVRSLFINVVYDVQSSVYCSKASCIHHTSCRPPNAFRRFTRELQNHSIPRRWPLRLLWVP